MSHTPSTHPAHSLGGLLYPPKLCPPAQNVYVLVVRTEYAVALLQPRPSHFTTRYMIIILFDCPTLTSEPNLPLQLVETIVFDELMIIFGLLATLSTGMMQGERGNYLCAFPGRDRVSHPSRLISSGQKFYPEQV